MSVGTLLVFHLPNRSTRIEFLAQPRKRPPGMAPRFSSVRRRAQSPRPRTHGPRAGVRAKLVLRLAEAVKGGGRR